MRIRRNIKHLSASQKTKFVNAVLALKTKPSVLHPGDPNLSRYDDYPEIHMNAMMASPGWAHRGPAFFPWHRVMLLEFENDLVAIDPDVTIPYWDWTDAASNPFTAGFLGGDGDPAQDDKVTTGAFAHDAADHWTIKAKDSPGDPDYLQRSFGTDPTAMALPTASDVTTALSNGTYDSSPWNSFSSGMRSAVELALHNLVHRWTGGTMGLMTSPNDPVFFLHHCNIDRLWAQWQRLNPGSAPYLPVSGAPLGHNLNDALIFSASPPAPWTDVFSPAGVIDHHALGYMYDDEIVIKGNIRELAYVRILFGVANCGPGWVIGPDGKPHPVPGGPGDPWLRLSGKERNELAARAIQEIAALMPERALGQSVGKLVSKAAGSGIRAAARRATVKAGR